jgi:hypothetical protein
MAIQHLFVTNHSSPFVYRLGTKCTQTSNFLEQFSLVLRNNLINFSICSFWSHRHITIIIRHIYYFTCCTDGFSNPTVPFCTHVSKKCLKHVFRQNLLHKSSNTKELQRIHHSNPTAQLTD